MSQAYDYRFARRPTAWGNMTRALRPSPGLQRVPKIPPMAAHWAPHAAGHWRRKAFHALTELPQGEHLPLLYLHALNFPLQFAILTHPDFPVPIWGVLQVRNHLILHAPVCPADIVTQEVRVVGQRTGEKSTEVDLHSRIMRDGQVVFEGLNTFWTRLRQGSADPPSPLAQAPAAGDAQLATWRAPQGGGFGFARVSGDFNGVHWAAWYARKLGFAGAFLHPQRVLGACLGRLAGPDGPGLAEPQRLDTWIKGPVYYGAAVTLRAEPPGPAGRAFALHVEGDPRPAFQGRVRPHAPGMALLDAEGHPVAS